MYRKRRRISSKKVRRPYKKPRISAPLVPYGFNGPKTRSVGVELNVLDRNGAKTITNATGELLLLNGIAQGTSVKERIGRRVMIRSINIKLMLSQSSNMNGDVTVDNDYASALSRVILIQDRYANGQLPDITDILSHVQTLAPVNWHTNVDNRQRFKLLWDKTLHPGTWTGPMFSNTDGVYVTAANVAYKKYKKVNIPTVFNSGTDDQIGSIQHNALYLCVLTSAIGATGNPAEYCRYQYSSRIRYTDA